MANELPVEPVLQVSNVIRSLQELRLAKQLDSCCENGRNDLGYSTAGEWCESLDEIFGNCMPRLFRVADRVLHNRYDSEDAMQDGLLSALRHIDQFQGNSQFSTWLCSIIRNSSLAKRRKMLAHPTVSVDERPAEDDGEQGMPTILIDSGPDPERACEQAELSFLFAQTLDDLPSNYRTIIRLCDFEGVSGKVAAQRLGLSVSALKSLHHRARLAVRESMNIHFARRGGSE
jgi:RNA polymerase sigma-70 factor (ECF subfamily)